MKIAELVKIYLQIESLDEELDEAEKGDTVEFPEIKGLRHGKKKFTLKDARLVCE